MNPEELYDEEDDTPFEEKDRIWNLLYDKISEAVDRNQNFAILFSGLIKEKDEAGEGYSAVISEDQFGVLLRSYLVWCESLERYEKCEEINKTIKKLKHG